MGDGSDPHIFGLMLHTDTDIIALVDRSSRPIGLQALSRCGPCIWLSHAL